MNKILDVLSGCVSVKDLYDFKNLVSGLQDLIQYNHCFCAFCNLKELSSSSEPDVHLIDVNYPPGLLDYYFEMNFNQKDPVIKEYFDSFSLINWEQAFRKHGMSWPDWAIDANLKNGYTHGTLEPDFSTAATFSFVVSKRDDKRAEALIEYLTPHLTEALKRCLGLERLNNLRLRSLLTKREGEVLEWLKQGKSSWEISMILNISERTINFHINNIMKKLNASNRIHAVAKAYNIEAISCKE